ncbi:MAG: hypothetical protein ACE5IM_11855, partial [Nitrospinota bacterium]
HLWPAAARRPARDPAAALRRAGAAALAGLLVLAGAAPAAAHHMRGQPHYGYAENYPQVPTRETRAQIDEYDVTVVSYFFQGLRRRRSDTPDDVQFYISLTDSRTGQSYTGPLSIELRRKGRRIAAFSHDRPFEEAVYRIRQAVPGPGRYELRLSTPSVRGGIFVDVRGDTTSRTPYVVTGAVLLIALLLFLNRRHRTRRSRGAHVARGA